MLAFEKATLDMQYVMQFDRMNAANIVDNQSFVDFVRYVQNVYWSNFSDRPEKHNSLANRLSMKTLFGFLGTTVSKNADDSTKMVDFIVDTIMADVDRHSYLDFVDVFADIIGVLKPERDPAKKTPHDKLDDWEERATYVQHLSCMDDELQRSMAKYMISVNDKIKELRTLVKQVILAKDRLIFYLDAPFPDVDLFTSMDGIIKLIVEARRRNVKQATN